MKIFKAVLVVVIGAILGVAGGVGVAMVIMWYFVRMHPDDPSAGSAGMVACLTVPVGFFVGILGTVYSAHRWQKRGKGGGFDVGGGGGRRELDE